MSRKFVPIKAPTRKKEMEQEDDASSTHGNMIPAYAEKGSKPNIRRGEKQVAFKDQGKGMGMEEDDFKFEVKNKQTVALEILEEGFSQSYIDFFYITNGSMPEIIEPSEAYREEQEKNKTKKRILGEIEEELTKLKGLLTEAEGFMRNDKIVALDYYSQIAEFFYDEKLKDFQTAAYFYKRCNSIAKAVGDPKWECVTLIGLGKCFAQLGRLDRAIENYENILKKADENQLSDIVVQVSRELTDIYGKMAASYENKDDQESINMALYYLEKCYESSIRGKDSEKEGVVCHKIGNIYVKKKEYEKALEYQVKNLKIAQKHEERDKKNVINVIEAHAALAKSYMALGRIEEALKHLEDYLKISKENRKLNYNADAAYHLARLWAMKGNNAKSIDFYQQHFESARNEKNNKDRRLIDKARVYLGMAKANANIENFIKIVHNSSTNIKPLLDWKSKKDK